MLPAFVLLCCVLMVAAGPIKHDNCTSGIIFNGRYYDREVLKTDVLFADNFSYLNRTLFFSYMLNSQEWQNSSELIATAYFNLDTKEFNRIPGLKDGSTTAVDSDNGEVYLAGDSGVYKFNPVTKTAEYFIAEGVDIWDLYYYHQIYYISFPDYKLYDSHGDLAYQTNVTVSRLIRDSTEYFLMNGTGLYRVINDDEGAAELFGELKKRYRGFSKDTNGNIYVFDTEVVYVPNREKKSLDKVAEFGILHGLAFDEDNNIIFSNEDEILRLTPSLVPCPSAA